MTLNAPFWQPHTSSRTLKNRLSTYEALTAVQIGLLTIYDMCKATDRGMVMGEICVLEKHGGKSGDWVAGG